MGNTPLEGLPYPEPTGRARNGSVDIKALADAIDPRLHRALNYDAGVRILPGESAAATGGAVDFPGTVFGMVEFTRSGNVFTYTGAPRLFVIAATVEVDVIGSAATSIESVVSLLVGGSPLVETFDRVAASASGVGTLERRQVVHTITTPVALETGTEVAFSCSSVPAAGAIGITSLHILPIGPRA